MTSVALNAALRIVTQTLMERLNEQLIIGSLCKHDYSNTEPRQPGDTVLVSPDSSELPPGLISSMDPMEYAAILSRSAPVTFRLQQEIVEFQIPDVSALLLDHAVIENDLQSTVDKLSGLIELGLIDAIAQFAKQVGSPPEGITPEIIDIVDRMLFEQADLPGRTHIVVDDPGWEQISLRCGGKAASFDISTPAPEFHNQMMCNAAFYTDALCLVTRRPQVNPTFRQLDIQADNIGLTVVVIPSAETSALTVKVIMLYAVGLFRKDLGVRIATIDTFSRAAADTAMVVGATQPHVHQPTVTLDELRVALPIAIADSTLQRLETIVESLADEIDNPYTRLLSAVKIMTRADGLKPTDLVEACSRQLQRMDAALDEFRNARDARFRAEIESRESGIVNTDAQIEATKQRLGEYLARRDTLKSEIEQELTDLANAESAFNADLQALRAGVDLLSADLLKVITGKPHRRKSSVTTAANVTLSN